MDLSKTPLSENEIRPDHLRAEQAKRIAADIERLLKSRGRFVPVSCPACGASRSQAVFEKYGLTYVQCISCETVYVNPRPTPEILEQYYAASENYQYWNQYIFPQSENARREKLFRPRLERLADICRRHQVPMNTLLEVGAGFGIFCEEAVRSGLFQRCIAVEPTPDLAATCRKRGLEVIEKPIEQVQLPPGTVSVAVSFEVIEHLFAPCDFIRACGTVLAPGGVLVLSCPNIKGFDNLVLKALSDSIDMEHLNYFHPSSLAQLVSANGFEVLEILTPGRLDAELVRKKILAGAFDVTPQPFLKQVLVDEWEKKGAAFQQFLADNMLSSHMWLVGRKQG